MALLVAVLLAGGRLASDLEIVAFKSAGVSALRLFRPVLVASLLVTVVTAALTLVVNPAANGEIQRQMFRILQARADERAAGTRVQLDVRRPDDLRRGRERLAGRRCAGSWSRTSAIRSSPGSSPRARAGCSPTRPTGASRLRMLNGAVNEADILPVDVPKATTAGAPSPTGGAAGASRYRYTRFEIYDMSLPVDSPLKGAPRVEKPEKDLSARRARGEDRRAPERSARPGALRGRATQAVRAADGRAGLRARGVSAGDPLAPRRPQHRAGREPGDPRHVLPDDDIARGRGAAHAYPGGPGDLDAERGVRRRRARAPDRDGATSGGGRQCRRRGACWRRCGARCPERPARRPRHHAGGPRDSTHIIDRYLVREYVGFMGIGLAVAAVLFIVVDLVKTLDKYLRVKPPLTYILEHFAYRLPAALHDGLPVVMLVATIFLFLTLSRYHELTALKAAGVSLYRVSAPVLGVGTGGGDRRRVLPGAGAAGAQRAWGRSGSGEDPRAGAAASAVAASAVGAERGHALLPRGAPQPGHERSLRDDDSGAGPRVSADRPARRPASALDGRRLGAERGSVPGGRRGRQGADRPLRAGLRST